MDVFQLRQSLVDEYKGCIESFIHIRDEHTDAFVDNALSLGALWGEPLIQLNPSYERRDSVEELVASSVLHPDYTRIFRAGKSENDPGHELLKLYRHQSGSIPLRRQASFLQWEPSSGKWATSTRGGSGL